MPHNPPHETASLAKLLDSAARDVHELEDKAKDALNKANGYQQHLLWLSQKCELLMTLPDLARPLMEQLPANYRKTVGDALDSMAQRAETALSLGSVFYMANLLYNDDHQAGQPNQLDMLAVRVSRC